jgi:hypothetical protein
MKNAEPQPARERRAHRRYPIALEVEYVLIDRSGLVHPGQGSTVNLSSSGALIQSAQPIPTGTFNVEVTVYWPAGQEGTAVMLVAHGRVVRRKPDGTVSVAFYRHTFKTAVTQDGAVPRHACPLVGIAPPLTVLQ